MEIVPIVAENSLKHDMNMNDIFELIKREKADTVAGNFEVTASLAADFLFSDPIYTVILIIFKLIF
jgi:hypothetical protein